MAGLGNIDTTKLKDELKRYQQTCSGKAAGIYSWTYGKGPLEDLAKNWEKAEKAASENKQDNAAVCRASYAGATLRDAEYSGKGRKYMRATALQSKMVAAYNRAAFCKFTGGK